MFARAAATIIGFHVVFAAPLYAREPQISLRAEPALQIVAPQKARINLIRTNLGPDDLHIRMDNAGPLQAEFDFDVRIRDGSGDTPAFTDYGKLVYGALPNNEILIDGFHHETIPAGQTLVSVVDVGKLYRLVRGKTYLVSCSLKKKRSRMSTPLVSNWVRIEVR